MNFNHSITEQIAHYEVTVNYNSLTGREIILVNGEQKYNRLNWTSTKSAYLLQLDEQQHIRVQLTLTLDSTLEVSFLRGGKVLASHKVTLYSHPSSKVLEEPENATWLAELMLPKRLLLLLPLSILLLMLTSLFNSMLLTGIAMLLLSLLCLAFMLKPLGPKQGKQPDFTKGILKVGFAKGLIYGASFGGVIGYSVSILTSTAARLLLNS